MKHAILCLSFLLCSVFAALPSQVLDLTNWALQLPTGPQGDPTIVDQPKLASFAQQPYFYSPDGSYVVFSAFVNGSHTSGSEYPRSELREMNGSADASWSNTVGKHVMTVKHAYTHLPAKRPEVVGAQILSSSGPVLQVRLNNPNIVVYGPEGNPKIVPNYVLGTIFTVQVEASDGQLRVYYNGDLKYNLTHSATECYFKTGAYVQSNLDYDAPTEYGEVQVYGVTVTHSD
jgi:hypothetical protein